MWEETISLDRLTMREQVPIGARLSRLSATIAKR